MRHTLVLTLTALLLAAPATAAHNPKPHKHARHAHTAKLVARAQFTGTAVGKLTAISSSSLTLRSDDREATCTIGDDSPKVGDFHVGDRVRVACANGVLTAIASLEPPVETTTVVGTLAARSDASVTVSTEKGDVTCKRTDASPKPGDVRVGDRVKMACTNGALTAIVKLDPPPVPPVVTPTVTTGAAGLLSALTPTSVTVHTDGGEVTCSRGSASPSLDGYAVGTHVRMTCTNGVLTTIAHL